MDKRTALLELQVIFSDQLNYSAIDPTESLNSLTYRTPEGDSCLHLAAVRGNTKATQILLDLGMDINLKGDMGNTALHYAQKLGPLHPTYQLLISRGASTEMKNEFGVQAGIDERLGKK